MIEIAGIIVIFGGLIAVFGAPRQHRGVIFTIMQLLLFSLVVIHLLTDG